MLFTDVIAELAAELTAELTAEPVLAIIEGFVAVAEEDITLI
jgi:hypothetical protein